jgi:hydrogenase nickel incorporation protein HypA/HybF
VPRITGLVVLCAVAMHELSIALSLVDLACEEKQRRDLPAVRALRLRLGARSGVVKDALTFSFDLAIAGTCLAGATLKIEETPGNELELFALEVED